MDGLLDIDPDIPDRELERLRSDVQEILDASFDHEVDARIVRLMRLKEMASDRFGLLAARSLEKSCSSLMRQETLGLDARFFDYDYRHLIRQLDELGQMRKDPATRWLFDATHPVLPARVAALEVFGRTERYFSLLNGDAEPRPHGLLDGAAEMAALGEILAKSELIPTGEDLAEVKLVACVIHRILKGDRHRPEATERMVRRLVWEFYRDFYASVPAEVFEIDFKRSAALVKDLGKAASGKPLKDSKGMVRDLVAYLKDRHLMSHDARDQVVALAMSMGLPRAVAVTYLKRAGAWRRFGRTR